MDHEPMRRAIAFCNFVKSSQQLEQRIHDVAERYADYTGDLGAPTVSARHVDGTFDAVARAEALAFLDETPGDETRIITRLIGAILLEQNDEWAVQRARYMTLESIAPVGHNSTVKLPAVAA